jgi:hypothetical protein
MARARRQTGCTVPASTSKPATAPAAKGVPRWPAIVALLVIGAIFLLVSDQLTAGPPWLPFAVIAVLMALLTVALLFDRHDIGRKIALVAVSIATVAVVTSTGYLVARLLASDPALSAEAMLSGGGLIWVANVVTFTVWYWEIDGGGPAMRSRDGHVSTDFLFPQLQVGDGTSSHGWAPNFLDYAFVAWNASIAFSPTDTLIMSRRAKILMMVQSLTSFVTVGVLVARAVNTLR